MPKKPKFQSKIQHITETHYSCGHTKEEVDREEDCDVEGCEIEVHKQIHHVYEEEVCGKRKAGVVC